MHDWHTADKILKLVLKSARENKLKKVNKIVIELGTILEHGQAIRPENLIFNLRNLSKNTMAAKAQIKVSKNKIIGWKLVEIEGE